jgi:hypothetical protein
MQWSRLYNEEAQDRRIRFVASEVGCAPAVVLGVLFAMKCHASAQEDDKRGTLAGWDERMVAFDLGIEPPMLKRIMIAMEGRYLEGKALCGWNKAQYATDGATARWRKWRDKQREQNQEDSEPPTLDQRLTNVGQTRQNRTEQIREEIYPLATPSECLAPPRKTEARGSRLPDDWQPSDADAAFAANLGLTPDAVAAPFRDYWHSQPGAKGRKSDWPATWRNWCRKEAERTPRRSGKPSQLAWLVESMQE